MGLVRPEAITFDATRIPTDALGSGTASASTFLRGDQTWATPAGGGGSPIVAAGTPISTFDVATTSYIDIVSHALTGIAAGDTIEVEMFGTILNNSGANATYRTQVELGSFTCETIDGTVMGGSATNRATLWAKGTFAVKATDECAVIGEYLRNAPTAANTGGNAILASERRAWQTGTTNLTGSQTVRIRMRSSTTTATQTFTLYTFRVWKIGAAP